MTAHQVTVVWEWMHNSGQWLPYESEVSNFVEHHYEKWQQTANSRLSSWAFGSQNHLAVRLKDVSSALANYSIDFKSWSQINATNGQVRPVRRQEYDCSGSAGTGVQWQWTGDVVGEWQPYTVEVSDAIERARNSGVSAIDLNKFPFFLPYIIRLPTMEQIRSGTQFTRAIRRRILNQSYKRSVGSQSSIVSHDIAKRQLKSSSGLPANVAANNSVAIFAGSSNVPSSFTFGNSAAAFSSQFSGPNQMPSSSMFGGGVPADLRGGNAANIQPSSNNVFGNNVFGIQQPTSSSSIGYSSSAAFTSNGASNSAGLNSNGRPPRRIRKLKSPAAGTNSVPSQSATQLQSTSSSLSPAASASASASSLAVTNQQLQATGTSGVLGKLFGSVTASSSSGSMSGQIVNFISNTASAASSYLDSVTSRIGNMSLKRKASSSGTNPFSPTKQSRSAPYTASTGAAAAVSRPVVLPQPTTRYTTVHQQFTSTANDKTRDILNDYIQVVSNPPKSEDCIICCDAVTEPSGYGGADEHTVVKLVRCSHLFHLDCICAMYDNGTKDGSVQCPTCKQIYGVKQGNCPRGTMTYRLLPQGLPGYTDCKTIEIVYDIRSGTQDGIAYTARGFPRCGYLPSNNDGLQVLGLLIKAWQRRLTFTIGTSVTTGQSNVVVWNEIHHKTSINNQDGHGYPDPNYLVNVLTELAAQGVTDDN